MKVAGRPARSISGVCVPPGAVLDAQFLFQPKNGTRCADATITSFVMKGSR